MTVVLYHHPMSLCSQKARLALAEKGVPYVARSVDIGRRLENYETWYARLNPGLVVPTLVHDDLVVTNSVCILSHVDGAFPGPTLSAEAPEARAACERWLRAQDDFPLRALGFGSSSWWVRWFVRFDFARRSRALARLAARHPELARGAQARQVFGESLVATVGDRAAVAGLRRQLELLLDEVDAALGTTTYLAGEAYTLADVAWTVFVARLEFLGLGEMVAARPALSAWYCAMKRRPSFLEADLWWTWRGPSPSVLIARVAGAIAAVASVLLAARTARRR